MADIPELLEIDQSLVDGPTGRPPALQGADFVPQVLACMAASFILIQTGINLAFSAVLLPQLMSANSALTITQDQASWIASIVTIATTVGSLLSGPLMDKFGRKPLCSVTCIPIIISWIIIAFTTSVNGLYCGRLLAGLGAGLSAAPIVYISEVVHQRWRPTMLCLVATWVSLGILLTCVLCLWMDYVWMALCFAGLAFCNLVITCPLPESPHWLLRNRGEKKACEALHWFYRRDVCFQHQLKTLLDSYQSSPSSRHTALSEYMKPSTLRPIGIVMVIFIFQQISGAYIVIFYAVNILQLVGGTYRNSINEYTAFALLGIIRFVMSIFTALVSRRCGRRPVSIVSGLGMAVSMVLAAIYISPSANSGELFQSEGLPTELSQTNISHGVNVDHSSSVDQWLPLLCVLVYVFFSSMGVLVIPWTLVGELPPVSVRGSCGGFLMAFSYVVMFAVVKLFPYLLEVTKIRGIFYIFGATSFLGAVHVFFFLPETQGKSFKEIEAYFT